MKQLQTLSMKSLFSIKNLKTDLLKVRLQHIALFAEIATKYGQSQGDYKNGMYLSFSIPKISVDEVTDRYKDKIGIKFSNKGDFYTKGSSMHVMISTADSWDFVQVYMQVAPIVNIE